MLELDRAKLDRALAEQYIKTLGLTGGQKLYIEHEGPKAGEMAALCSIAARRIGVIPSMVDIGGEALNREIAPMLPADIEAYGRDYLDQMRSIDAYMRVKDDVEEQKLALKDDIRAAFMKAKAEGRKHRIETKRWMVVAALTDGLVTSSRVPAADFERMFYDSILLDYGVMTREVQPLLQRERATNQIRIVRGDDTDLTFSREGVDCFGCTGELNLPDGECVTAPVKTSVNGRVRFGRSNFLGKSFDFIDLRFVDGKAVEAYSADADSTRELNKILDMDEGARYVGEFAISFNPCVKHLTGNILFDEKTAGAWHFALGACYEQWANNGNKSAIHWDMIQRHGKKFGGGEIHFDGQLVRKNGLFVRPELVGLNPKPLLRACRLG